MAIKKQRTGGFKLHTIQPVQAISCTPVQTETKRYKTGSSSTEFADVFQCDLRRQLDDLRD